MATFTGTLTTASQEDSIAFDFTTRMANPNANGVADLVLLMSAENDAHAPIDPGLISVFDAAGTAENGPRRPDSANSTSSIALTTLTKGVYMIRVQSEHKTIGAYRLEALLAGDANGDYQVDAADLQIIAQLTATKRRDPGYSALADVDRNGVINGGDVQRARRNLGARARPPSVPNPLDQGLPPGSLSLLERSSDTFGSTQGGLKFSLVDAEFQPAAADVTLSVNGVPVPTSQLVVEPHRLTANIVLSNGKNHVSLATYDTIGRALYYQTTLWAGSSSLQVKLVNPGGSVFLGQAIVVAALSDDPSVVDQDFSDGGSVTFTNVPDRTILVKAKGPNNEIGSAGIVGSQGLVTVTMVGFNAPSPIANNDFSLGTQGWTIAPGSPVSVGSHKEVIAGFPEGTPALAAFSTFATLAAAPAESIVDQDITLGTSGLGERSISRSFTTAQGTTGIKLRYRFVTSEVPGGYFGSRFNDYFRVSLRSQQGSGTQSETNSMNGLGLAAFNRSTGETNWREITLPVDRSGDTIQVDAAVANVGDGAFQSQVVIDFVEELRDQVRPALAWNNTQGGLNLAWEVLDRPLENAVTISVQFAGSATYAGRLGNVVFTHSVPAGTPVGPGQAVHIAGTLLSDDPSGATHLIAYSTPSMVGTIADVRIAYGPNANAAVVADVMTEAVKDGLRAAGASVGTITSTMRTPEDQARAMFNNAVRTGAQEQLDLYGPAGDAVIQVFIDETAGLTAAEIQTNRADIQAAMVDEINAQGPERVSKHCGDPTVRSVVDVAYASFNSSNRPLFRTFVSDRVSSVLDEPNNSCLHLELAL